MWNPGLLTAATRLPEAVVALFSALHAHGLATETPRYVSIALPRGAARPRLDWPPLRVYHMSGAMLSSGIQTLECDGVAVRVYRAAKTMADCPKVPSRIGTGVAPEALRSGLAERTFVPAEIPRAAMRCRVDAVVVGPIWRPRCEPSVAACPPDPGPAQEPGTGDRPSGELVELFAVERFLLRLGRPEDRDRFLLKGGLLLRQWLGANPRPTRDIGLLGTADLDASQDSDVFVRSGPHTVKLSPHSAKEYVHTRFPGSAKPDGGRR